MTDSLTFVTFHSFLLLCFAEWVRGTTLTAFRREPTVLPLTLAIARDSRYGPWANATGVLYQLDPSYGQMELSNIKQAMELISADMNGCVRFQPYSSASHTGLDHIYIGKTLNSGAAFPACFSFPGRVLDQSGHGQKVALFGSSNTVGCADSVRDVMKYLGHVLGLRNEINRPDRDRYVQVFNSNVRPELQTLSLFRKYTNNQMDYLNATFDYNSITISDPRKYAVAGSVVASILNSQAKSFGNLARLSLGDCTGIALQYNGCSYAKCRDPYKESASSTGRPTTTTQTSTPVQGTSPIRIATSSTSTPATSTVTSTTTSRATPKITQITTVATIPTTATTLTVPITPRVTTVTTSTITSTISTTTAMTPVTSTSTVASTTRQAISTTAVEATQSGSTSSSVGLSTDSVGSTMADPWPVTTGPQDWEMPELVEKATGLPVEPSFSLTL